MIILAFAFLLSLTLTISLGWMLFTFELTPRSGEITDFSL